MPYLKLCLEKGDLSEASRKKIEKISQSKILVLCAEVNYEFFQSILLETLKNNTTGKGIENLMGIIEACVANLLTKEGKISQASMAWILKFCETDSHYPYMASNVFKPTLQAYMEANNCDSEEFLNIIAKSIKEPGSTGISEEEALWFMNWLLTSCTADQKKLLLESCIESSNPQLLELLENKRYNSNVELSIYLSNKLVEKLIKLVKVHSEDSQKVLLQILEKIKNGKFSLDVLPLAQACAENLLTKDGQIDQVNKAWTMHAVRNIKSASDFNQVKKTYIAALNVYKIACKCDTAGQFIDKIVEVIENSSEETNILTPGDAVWHLVHLFKGFYYNGEKENMKLLLQRCEKSEHEDITRFLKRAKEQLIAHSSPIKSLNTDEELQSLQSLEGLSLVENRQIKNS